MVYYTKHLIEYLELVFMYTRTPVMVYCYSQIILVLVTNIALALAGFAWLY